MKPTTSKRAIGTLAITAVLIIGFVSAVPFSAFAQDGVQTPTPSGGSDDPYDCGDFDNREQVEAVFEANNDISGLDNDNDGIACESIGEPTEQTPTETPDTNTPTEAPDTETPTEEPTEDTETTTEAPEDNTTDTPSDDEQSDNADDKNAENNDKKDSKDNKQTENNDNKDTEKSEPPC